MTALERIGTSGLVPVVRIEDARDAPELARTLAGAGLPCIEITFRSDAAEAAIRAVLDEVPDVLVGAGTVLSLTQLERALAAGAKFIVSPGLQVEVVQACLDRGVPVLPGILTPTELIRAMDLGLTVVKLFPGGVRGWPGLSAGARRPVPDRSGSCRPAGSMRPNWQSYLRVPSVLAVGGSWMVPADLLAARDWASVGRLAAAATAIVRTVRGSVPR